MRTRPFLFALLLLAAAAAWGQAPLAPGAARGTFMAAGKTVPMRHVYALIKPNELDDGNDALYLVLTDVPVTEETLRQDWGLAEAWRAGKLNAVELRLDENKTPACGQLYHSALGDASVSVCGIAKLDLKFYDGKQIRGRLFTGPQESFGSQWELAADFAAAILPKPAPLPEKLLPLDSAPAKLALAFVKAAQARDKAALKRLVSPDMAADLDGPQGADILKMLPEMFPPAMKLTKVVQKGDDRAEIIFTEKSKGSSATTTLKAALRDGAWVLTK